MTFVRWLLAVLLLLAPIAGALPPESPRLTVQGADRSFTVVPDSSAAHWNVTFAWSCSAAELRLGPSGVQRLALSGAFSAGLNATFAPQQVDVPVVPAEECTDDTLRHSVPVAVTAGVGTGTPAVRPLRMALFANLSQTDASSRSQTWGPMQANATVIPAFKPVVQFRPTDVVKTVSFDSFTLFPIDVLNLGNGPVKITGRIQHDRSPNITVEAPPPFVVQPAWNGTNHATTYVHAHGDGERGAAYAFQILFNYTYAGDGSHASGEAVIPLTLNVRSLVDEAPGPGPFLQAAALTLAFGILFRVRRRLGP